MVFQHVAYEPLGTLDPLIRIRRHKIRYINFGRSPLSEPNLDGYDALIILGGPMNIGEEESYPHLNIEKRVIRQAVHANIPILGICLGAQLIAAAVGARVYPANQAEIGWYPMRLTKQGQTDKLAKLFSAQQHIFQWHGFTFDLPTDAIPLLNGDQVVNQAFKLNDNIYGFQFHLEADLPLINRWLELPAHQAELGLDNAKHRIKEIWRESEQQIERSLALSETIFGAFLDLLPSADNKHTFSHR